MGVAGPALWPAGGVAAQLQACWAPCVHCERVVHAALSPFEPMPALLCAMHFWWQWLERRAPRLLTGASAANV